MRAVRASAVGVLSLVWMAGCASQAGRECGEAGVVNACGAPATVWDDPETLARVKAEFACGVGPTAALTELTHEADDALKTPVVSVMDKAKPGPSGDKHDYVSYAPYFWPNPDTKNGLPYVRHDGHRNQAAVSNGDANHYEGMNGAIHTLGVAYWYTGNPAYAQKAAALARAWYIDPATRMNPNFQYAQAILGVTDGRGIGLIENRGIVQALDGLTLIADSGEWTVEDRAAMRAWVKTFDHWMTTSERGLSEKAAKNNHGSWYEVQEAGLALWLGDTGEAHRVFEEARRRIVKQIQPSGRQLLEIVRTDGFGYSVFNMQALSVLAGMAQRHGVDLWHFERDGRGMRKAIDYLMPFANRSEKWKDNQLKAIDADGLAPVVMQAARVYGDEKYAVWLSGVNNDELANEFHLTGG